MAKKTTPSSPTTPEIEFEDSESYRGQSDEGITIRVIILKQLQNCVKEGSKEMTKGGIIGRVINGQYIEVPVPNQKEVFINNVSMLRYLLLPQLKTYCEDKYDKNKDKDEIKISIKTFDDKLDKIEKEHKTRREQILSDYNKKNNKKRFLPEVNEKLKHLDLSLEDHKIKLYKELLKDISFLLKNINYFEEEGVMAGAI